MGMIVTIHKHPTDKRAVLIEIPADTEAHRIMGSLGGIAMLNRDLGGYVVHESQLDRFHAWARNHDVGIVDQTHGSTSNDDDHEKRQPLECTNCGHPTRNRGGNRSRKDERERPAGFPGDIPPLVCPACGVAFDGVHPEEAGAARLNLHTCTRCKHRQTSRLPYCSNCGQPMTFDDDSDRIAKPEDDHPLEDPVTLATTMAELAEHPKMKAALAAVKAETQQAGRTWFDRDDWIAYRAFWATMPRDTRLTDGIEEWHGFGRPATWTDLADRLHPRPTVDAPG